MSDKCKEKENRLNRAARLWKTTPSEGNEALIESLRQQVFTLSFELFDSEDNAMAFMTLLRKHIENMRWIKGRSATI